MLAVLLLATALTFGQQGMQNPVKKYSNQEIVNILNMSAELNGGFTIQDLDHPWMLLVGQSATYKLQDGSKIAFIAKQGDNYWTLGKQALAYQDANPGNPIVSQNEDILPKEESAVIPPVTGKNNFNYFWWFPVIVGLAILFSYLFFGRKKTKKEKVAEQTFTNLVQEGITDANAPAYMREVASRMGPNVRIVGPVIKGRLTTTSPMEVSYVEGTKMESFENEPFFRALAEVDGGDPTYLYFRQICGNDAKAGRIQMGGDNIIFTPDPVQTPELQTANQQVLQPQTEIQETKTDQPVIMDSTAMLNMLGNAVKSVSGKENGKVTFEAGNVKFYLEFHKETILPTNGVVKDETAKNEVKALLS